jgi:hypothetical protein
MKISYVFNISEYSDDEIIEFLPYYLALIKIMPNFFGNVPNKQIYLEAFT